MHKKKIKYFASLLVGILILGIFVYFLGASEVYNTFKNAQIKFILFSLLLISLTYFFRALRWNVLLKVFKKKIRFANIFTLTALSYYVNIIAPFRFGELVRLYLLRTKEGIPIKKSSITIIIISFLEIVAAFFWGVVGLILAYFLNSSLFLINGILIWAILIIILLFFVLLALMFYPKIFIRIADYVLSFFSFKFKNKISSFLNKFFNAFSYLRDVRVLSLAFVYALCIQFFIIIAYYLMFLAFNIKIALITMAIGNLVITFTLVIPTTPGRVGSYEAVWLIAFLPFGLVSSEVLAVSIGAHLVVTLCALLIGGFSVYYLGIKNIDRLLERFIK
ncbi:flippase-like domain-containing protein [Candidatus Woesearchaeota archaeon]|nr:flippase-like domain-containing protein [Candidatus Woesearchaeota archaeon]